MNLMPYLSFHRNILGDHGRLLGIILQRSAVLVLQMRVVLYPDGSWWHVRVAWDLSGDGGAPGWMLCGRFEK